jgi:hypothetical protein
MKKAAHFRFCLVILCLLALPLSGVAQVLYDGSTGLPNQQGWAYAATGGSQTLGSGGVLLNTTASTTYQAGNALATSRLNRTNGFTIQFTLQMFSETHLNSDRAGFCLIVLGDDKRGLQLDFWTTNIYAQADSPLFTHAEGATFGTTNLVNYALTFHPTNYVLTANGATILTGFVRDYTAFTGFPNPYTSANFIFFGDNAASAASSSLVQKITLISAPQLSASTNGVITWTGIPNQTYTVQTSSDLQNWNSAGTAASTSSQFSYTNNSPATVRFFRVVYP